MDTALADALLRYLAGLISLGKFGQHLDGYDIWNGWQDRDPATIELREAVGELDLLVADVAEGFRDSTELRDLAQRILAAQRAPELAFHLTASPAHVVVTVQDSNLSLHADTERIVVLV